MSSVKRSGGIIAASLVVAFTICFANAEPLPQASVIPRAYADTPYPGYPAFVPSPDTGTGYLPFKGQHSSSSTARSSTRSSTTSTSTRSSTATRSSTTSTTTSRSRTTTSSAHRTTSTSTTSTSSSVSTSSAHPTSITSSLTTSTTSDVTSTTTTTSASPTNTCPAGSTTDLEAGSEEDPAQICEADGTICVGYGNEGTVDTPCYPCAKYPTDDGERYSCTCEAEDQQPGCSDGE